MKKHFVTFYSPGTFVSESDTVAVSEWDVPAAVKLATEVKQRHRATPYAFQFSTRSRGAGDLDSKVTAKSGMYWLCAKVETLQEIEARNDPSDAILLSNMRCNGWSKVATNLNGYSWTLPLEDGDVVLSSRPATGKGDNE